MADQNVEGLPEGATLRPLQSASQPEIEGLPEGATVRPLSAASTSNAQQHPAGWHEPIAKPAAQSGLLDTANEYYEKGTGIGAGLGRLALMGPNMIRGAYHAITDEPKTAEESAIESGGAASMVPGAGRMALAGKRLLYDPQAAEADKAKAEAEQGHTAESMGHSIAAGVPLVGPYASNIAERAGRGDISGAATELGGLLAVPEVAKEAMPGGALPGAAAEGARPFPVADSMVRGASRAASKMGGTAPYLAGAATPHPFIAAKAIRAITPDFVAEGVEKGKTFGLNPEEAAHQQLEERAVESEKEAAKAQAVVDRYKASTAQGIEPPEDVVKASDKAKAKATEDRMHADNAKEAIAKPTSKEKPVTLDHMAGLQNDIDRMAPRPGTPKAEPAPTPKPINVKGPGEVQPETIAQPTEETPRVPRTGQETLANNQGRMGRTYALPEAPLNLPQEVLPPEGTEAPAPKAEKTPQTVEGGLAPVPPDETVKTPANATKKSVDKVGDLVNEGLGNERLKANVPLKEQGPKIRSEIEPEQPKVEPELAPEKPKADIPKEEAKVPEKLSSDPRKATLQKAGATPEEMDKILSRGTKTDPTSKVGLSKLAEHFGVDLGDKAIGRGKGDVAAGTHLSPDQVLQKIIDAGHSPADIAKAVDEGKHLPTVAGGSPEGAAAKQTVGTAEGAKADTYYVHRAMAELGPTASMSDILKKAQEFKESKGPWLSPDIGEWKAPPELGAFSAEDTGAKVRAANPEPTGRGSNKALEQAEALGGERRTGEGLQEGQTEQRSGKERRAAERKTQAAEDALFKQARQELGDDATTEAVVARMEELRKK